MTFNLPQRVLILSPHPDDAELGMGGTIAKFIENGVDVHIAVFSDCKQSLPTGVSSQKLIEEARSSIEKMGLPVDNHHLFDYPVRRFSENRQDILEDLVALKKKINPDLVFCPSKDDRHQDHLVLHEETKRAFGFTLGVYGYELPWNMTEFSGRFFVELTGHHLKNKCEYIFQYQSQLDLERTYFKSETIESLSRVRGLQAGCLFAEAFEVIRSRW
ncbi:N-acetylglucosaminylphosphatidylinositol deacetylase [Candidatus Terasakiella magnetica]|uniref:N-acetylglucosaminylphosphatidylinositol deacetylase n=1 Tax=Candidatus Terasakiella magnetica TaxID=1867952 RepID=A0A1C3RG15_9PROT|nr:PIG-L deacetylase family protein [Candidatus Terasakiella magnetica]SCA56220.1 N-acetylglucosaminylphosphatidylinositol deacetylase [Candidatus Terasakiella magnetica]